MPNNLTFPQIPKSVRQPWDPDLNGFAKMADVMPKASDISGYDAAKVQTLQHDATGKLKWVDVSNG